MTATEIATMDGAPLPVTRSTMPVRQSPAALAEQAQEIREVMRAVLVENTDYGVIPGTNKPSLYKSGAEWLLKWGGFGHRLEPVEVERDADGRKYGVTYRCTVTLLSDPSAIVSTCDGYAGMDEDRFCQSVEELMAKEKANATKYKRAAAEWKWAAPYRAPWNSVLKMAEKRALVGATLQACAASGLFTQDMEDHAPAGVREPTEPTDWFVANGWDDGDAEEDAHHRALMARHKALSETPRADFDGWAAANGIDLKKALKREQWEQATTYIDALAGQAVEDATGDETTVESGNGRGEEPEPRP